MKTEKPEIGPLPVAKLKPYLISNITPPGHEDFNPISVGLWLQMHLKEQGSISNNVSVSKFDGGRGGLHLTV